MQLYSKIKIRKVSYGRQKKTHVEIRGKGYYSNNSMIISFFPLECKVNHKEKNLREVRIHRAMVFLHVKAKLKN